MTNGTSRADQAKPKPARATFAVGPERDNHSYQLSRVAQDAGQLAFEAYRALVAEYDAR